VVGYIGDIMELGNAHADMLAKLGPEAPDLHCAEVRCDVDYQAEHDE
jgi:hypothetical protein